MITVQKRKSPSNIINCNASSPVASSNTARNRKKQKLSHTDQQSRLSSSSDPRLKSLVPSKGSLVTNRAGNICHFQAQTNPLNQSADGAKSNRGSSDESVWIFGLINNIEQLLSSFNTDSMMQDRQQPKHHRSGSSTPISLSSSNLSIATTQADSPKGITTSSQSSSLNQQQHFNAAPTPSRNPPLSRQIKFHEYKGPPSARRQQQNAQSLNQSQVQNQTFSQVNPAINNKTPFPSNELAFQLTNIKTKTNIANTSQQQVRQIVQPVVNQQPLHLVHPQYSRCSNGQTVLLHVGPAKQASILTGPVAKQAARQPIQTHLMMSNGQQHSCHNGHYMPMIANQTAPFQVQSSHPKDPIVDPNNVMNPGARINVHQQQQQQQQHDSTYQRAIHLEQHSQPPQGMSICSHQAAYPTRSSIVHSRAEDIMEAPNRIPSFFMARVVQPDFQTRYQYSSVGPLASDQDSGCQTVQPFFTDDQLATQFAETPPSVSVEVLEQPENSVESNTDTNSLLSDEFTFPAPNESDLIGADEIEPTIGFSNGIDELLFSEFIDLQDIPVNVNESDWLKKFLPPCSMG